ncbi:MAG: LCP family protein [Acidimicrobiales bacterium]
MPDSSGRLRAWRMRRREKKSLRSTLRRRLTRTGIAVLLLAVLLAGGGIGYVVYKVNEIQRVKVRNLVPVASAGRYKGIEDILLVGSTSRCALKVQNPAFGLCQNGVNGVNGDVVMVLRLDGATHRVTLLSFPRDTFIPNARPGQYNRIDSALAYGPGQLVSAIEEDFGVPINHYVVLNFDTFAAVVDALGGVNVYFPDRLYDNYSQLDITKTGCLHLNGFQALALVRARHMYYWTAGQTMDVAAIKAGNYGASGGEYDGSGDIGRIERDHIFLKILASEVAHRGLGNPVTDNELLSAVAPQLQVDTTFGVSEMLHLVLAFHGVDIGASPETTLPIIEDTQPYIYQGYNYGDLVFPSAPQDQEAIQAFMGPIPGVGLHPASVSVSVLGGIGSPSATAHTAAQLAKLGYRVLGEGEQTPVGSISETSVIYSPGHIAEGQRVLASLSGAVALGVGKTLDGADVTVVTGTDFQVHGGTLPALTSVQGTGGSGGGPAAGAPGPARLSVSTGHASVPVASRAVQGATQITLASLVHSVLVSSTSSPGYADGGVLAPPTSATVSVPPYDPRACPSSSRAHSRGRTSHGATSQAKAKRKAR